MGSIPPCFFVSAAAPPSGAPCSWVAVIALVVFLVIACSVYYIILDSLLAHLKKHFFFTLIGHCRCSHKESKNQEAFVAEAGSARAEAFMGS